MKTMFKVHGRSVALLILLAGGAAAQAQTTTLFSEDFGTGTSRSATANAYVPSGFGFLASGNVADNYYAIIGNGSLPDPGTTWSEQIPGYADDNRVMVVNAGTTQASMYQRAFTASVNHTYTLSAKRYIINGNRAAQDQNGPLAWSMEISQSGTTLFNSGAMNSDPSLHRHTPDNNPDADWQLSEYRFSFIVDRNCETPMEGNSLSLQADLFNRTSETSGNDFYVDDIQLVEGPVDSDSNIPSICVKPPPAPPTSVPTLDGVGLGLLSLLGAGAGALALRRRRKRAV